MNPMTLTEQAKKYDTYPKFRDHLIATGVIQAATDEVKRTSHKGLKEFYKSVKRG